MANWTIKALDREVAESILAARPHHIQSSLAWFDFLRGFTNECDRSVSIEYCGESIGFLCALQHRNLIQSLPYPASYGGVQTTRSLNGNELRELYQSLFAHYSRLCDVVSICTSPFYSGSAEESKQFDFQSSKDVHYLDLTREPLANTTSKFRNNLRRNLQKADNAQVKIAVSSDRRDLAAWYRCYERRINELGGVLLTQQYFEQMFERLEGSGNCALITAKSGNQFLGGIVTVQNRYCVDYYLSMFDRDYDEMQASTAAFYFLISYARSLDAQILNLQSSPASQIELIRFKESWGALRAEHSYLTKIVNNREKVLRMTEQQITQDYRYHYLLPFAALKPELSLV